jgi:hypothetical protein
MKKGVKAQALNSDKVSSRYKSCAGCRALEKYTNTGVIFPYGCRYRYTQIEITTPIYDKRLDSMINLKPKNNCKVLTNKEMVMRALNSDYTYGIY